MRLKSRVNNPNLEHVSVKGRKPMGFEPQQIEFAPPADVRLFLFDLIFYQFVAVTGIILLTSLVCSGLVEWLVGA